MPDVKLKGSEKNTYVPKKSDFIYEIPLRRWNRLKVEIESIPERLDWWNILWTVFFGLFTAFLGVTISVNTNKFYYLLITIFLSILLLITLYFKKNLVKLVGSSKKRVLDRIEEIEEDYEDLNSVKSSQDQAQEPQLKVQDASYGTTSDHTFDVTEKVKTKVQNNSLVMIADNSIAGDPDPGVVKYLEVEYLFGNRLAKKRVKEGEELRLP